jgi:Spy/CpxP family protein refolding chaperone
VAAGAEGGRRNPAGVRKEFFMKPTRIVFFLFLLVCLVSEGHAQGVGRNGRQDSSPLSSRDVSIIKELNLTESQVKETRRIGAAYSNRTLKLRSEIIGKSIEFRNLLHDPSASEEAIRAKGKEIEVIDAQLIREKIDFQIEMRKVLTPEQLQRWYVVMDQQPATKKPIR